MLADTVYGNDGWYFDSYFFPPHFYILSRSTSRNVNSDIFELGDLKNMGIAIGILVIAHSPFDLCGVSGNSFGINRGP